MFALVSIGVYITLLVVNEIKTLEQPEHDYSYDPDFTTKINDDIIKFTQGGSGLIMRLTHDGKMELGSPPIAIVDLETGTVDLKGDPSEAAKLFWEAVELMRQ